MKEDYSIKEDSFIARAAAWKLGSEKVAIVIGNTIYLHNSSREELLSNQRWLKHELCHINQYRKYGTAGFIMRYLWESLLHGYHNNKYEAEARKAETL